MSLPDLPPIAFRQAVHFTAVGSPARPHDLVVIHAMESSELDLTAENMAAGISNLATTWEASWHYGVDRDSIVQSVRDEDVAWGAPGANRNGIQVELAGRAAQTAGQWDDPYSRAMLLLAANLTAHLCHRYVIPARRVGAEELRTAGTTGVLRARGITGHADVSLAFRKSNHTDPGAAFPWPRFIATVRALLAGA